MEALKRPVLSGWEGLSRSLCIYSSAVQANEVCRTEAEGFFLKGLIYPTAESCLDLRWDKYVILG